MQASLLPDRGVVKVAGPDARSFLNGLLTANIESLAAGDARYAALLTPQGKIIADCLVTSGPSPEDGFFLDVPRALAEALCTRLGFYKLRAKVTVEDRSAALGVVAVWGDGAAVRETDAGLAFADPRFAPLGWRLILPPSLIDETIATLGATRADETAYDTHRIAHTIPRGGLDFIYGDSFPHEAGLDQLSGVDFAKGCYVGQEVVSRTEHRGTARTRIVATHAPMLPDVGLPIMAGETVLGTTGSSANGNGIALVRLDRLADAIAAGTALVAGGMTLGIRQPAWARYTVPATEAAA